MDVRQKKRISKSGPPANPSRTLRSSGRSLSLPSVSRTFPGRCRGWGGQRISGVEPSFIPEFSANLVDWQPNPETPVVLTGDGRQRIIAAPYPSHINWQEKSAFSGSG